MEKPVRVRIAPSPTGPLHIGTARTALFNYLFAKKFGGHFILRIEDTDLERSDKKYEKDIFDGLAWLGIDADESPEKGGKYGPYRQSERIGTYKKYLGKLLADGAAFYCLHSEQELSAEKETLMAEKKPLAHWCEFRDVPLADAETKLGQSHVIRFKTPHNQKIVFKDIIRGELSFDSELIGDFSIAKDIDVPLYNFAVVIDDAEMKISHVIRGEEHISNTPKQLLLMVALGFEKPGYAHLPLILGTDRSKLSKRRGATSVIDYKNEGYLPEALFNFMALLGWNPGDEREILSKEELKNEFSLEKIQKSGAIFDITKLDWMNGEYIRKKSTEDLVALCLPYLEKIIAPELLHATSYKLQTIIALEQPRLKKLSEIGERVEYFFKQPEYDKELLRWKKMSDTDISASLEKSEKIITQFKSTITKTEIEKEFLKEIGDGDKGIILWPLRVALTGKKASPSPFEILEIMERDVALERIAIAKKKIVA
ncbi:MAG: glutamate--tRNA ligase [bacterium]|nr:glutamate--tRNA ligase [bacterium]